MRKGNFGRKKRVSSRFIFVFENVSIYIHGPDYVGSLEQDNINKSSESLERDLNGTARLLVRLSYDLAFEQALRGALAAEREKERELATTSLEFQVACGSASTMLSDFRQSARNGNERE